MKSTCGAFLGNLVDRLNTIEVVSKIPQLLDSKLLQAELDEFLEVLTKMHNEKMEQEAVAERGLLHKVIFMRL